MIDYYDYYGPLFYSLNGLEVLTSDINPILVDCIPMAVSGLFLVMFAEFFKVHPGIKNKAIIVCIVIFLAVWFYNIAVTGHIEDKYFDEYHYPGFAGDLAFLISIANVFVAYFLEKKIVVIYSDNTSVYQEPPIQQWGIQQKTNTEDFIQFCPGCGLRLSDAERESGYCSRCSMRFK